MRKLLKYTIDSITHLHTNMLRNFINNKQWKALLKESDISNELRNTVEHFMLPDKIDYEKYLQNYKANEICISGTGLKNWEMANNLSAFKEVQHINCTPTFRKFYADNSLDRSPSIPYWFYIAYPDVEHWFQSRMNIIDSSIANNSAHYLSNGKPNNNLYRLIIDKYKSSTGLHLECSI